MKTSWIVLLALLSLLACNKQADPGTTSHITGTVDPVFQEYLAFSYADFLDSVKIDREGHFNLYVPGSEAGYGILMYNNSLIEVYIEPGKMLDISINSNNFPDNIEFGGELGPMNHYMQLARKLDHQTDISSDELFSKDPEVFSSLTDSIRNTKSRLLREYVVKYPEMDSNFARKKATDILYTWANQQLLYPGYYLLLKNQIPNLPDQYHQEYLKELELNNSDLLISPMYKTFLENYLDFKEAVYLENHPEAEKLWFPGSVARFRVIHEEFTSKENNNYLLFRSMSDHLDNFGTDHVETFITNFRVSCTNEDYKTIIEKKFNMSETLARGKQAPELDFFDKEGNKIKLSDLKGKMLYLNFWASWSEWSIQEFPYWEKLRKDFEGYDILFVSVSMDFVKDRNKWEYILDKQKLGGMQLIQDPESKSFIDQYFINDLPRYILIDANGAIISVHAPRPSENMELVLKNLLKK